MDNKEKSMKNVEDMSIIEIKAILFDLNQEIQLKQEQYQRVMNILARKVNQNKEGDE